jgi:hypothetical protein
MNSYSIKNVTLEMSLKPFMKMDNTFIEETCRELFRQWWPLTRHADVVSVLLWTADGSEILTYKGNLNDEIEWAKYIGGANPRENIEVDCLHSRCHLYIDHPPVITLGNLKNIVSILKKVGTEITGKPIRVGETFDPGPEFAKSPFKYEKHNEICLGGTMGKTSFVCCYATLNADSGSYAGFPNGIPQDTPLGTFLGRQCQHFLTDLGFDYLWLSNGFGFGSETWGLTGAIFDGEKFDAGKIGPTREKIMNFWKLFRKECPNFLIETRGTNLSTGMDLSSDGVDLANIYRGGFNLEPPPNSPWAALDGDFGLEMIGYMSHIAELPGETFPFRYYVHDPWWLNSPWLDRYGREPHDIYLPMSIARINGKGEINLPTSIEFLTVDNSFGEMPVQCPNEVIPHILKARQDSSDEPGPIVWVYPFDEYHSMTFDQQRVDEVFFGDWFMRSAVNNGFPVNTVVSTRNFLSSPKMIYKQSILTTVVPDAGSAMETALIDFVEKGGKVLLYGPLSHASEKLLSLWNLKKAKPVSGEFILEWADQFDQLSYTKYPNKIHHNPLLCAGGLDAILRHPDDEKTQAITAGNRVIALSRNNSLAWVRGTNSNTFVKGHSLLVPGDPNVIFPGELLMRYLLKNLGMECLVTKRTPDQRNPVLAIARNDNGFFFSGYNPDTTVGWKWRFEQGAPLLLDFETWLENGRSTYTLPRAWHRECRVFIDNQIEGLISCREEHSAEWNIRRRCRLTGLKNATVRFYPEGDSEHLKIQRNGNLPEVDNSGHDGYEKGDGRFGKHIVVQDVTGSLVISW